MTGDLINGSTATGILAVAYSLTGSSGVHYQMHTVEGDQQNFEYVIEPLAGGEYGVSAFVVEKNGLPFERAATKPKFVSVSTLSSELILYGYMLHIHLLLYIEGTEQLSIEYEIILNSTGVCIVCTFLDSSATDCVAVVHQRISQLSSSGLMNIESSHKFNRAGDTASGCLKGVSLEDYQFGVIGGRQVKQMISLSRGELNSDLYGLNKRPCEMYVASHISTLI